MKSYTILVFLALFTILNLQSQDIIIKRNGEEIKSKILEIQDYEIKYKIYDYLSGPVYTLPKIDIFMIKFENGEKVIFNSEETIQQENAIPEEKKPNQAAANIGFNLLIALGLGLLVAILLGV